MNQENPLKFKDRDTWRTWLKDNHTKKEGVWLVLQKKKSKKQGLKYNEAVEESLCYGWIDGKIKRLNDDEFIQRFTPRRKNSNWSKYNIERATKLIEQGKKTSRTRRHRRSKEERQMGQSLLLTRNTNHSRRLTKRT